MKNEMTSEKPIVFEFYEYRTFIERSYKALNESTRLSHREFARRAGLSSPSALSSILSGRRKLNPISARAFAQALVLDTQETEFFVKLVEYEECSSMEKRANLSNQLQIQRRLKSTRLITEAQLSYAQDPNLPLIRELINAREMTSKQIHVAFQSKISEAKCESALRHLHILGLIEQASGDIWKTSSNQISTPSEIPSEVLVRYHQQMIEEAIQSLIHQPRNERDIRSGTFAIDSSRFPEMKIELAQFLSQLVAKYEAKSENKDAIFQLNLQAFQRMKF